ncbi:MAG: septum site-determining protein MinC [Defluviitaleaceae bacterium]|nr:septum site-determining protein MinC [Defluviitaleaceae bacterium]MCL2262893.1 septum site-determining protein MinC [Defluviitaleaceae bacterium]
MATKQIVTLKGQKDGISIILDAEADFEAIKESLRKKVSQGKQFFDGADTKVAFKGRELDDFAEKTLIDIITEETNLDITFVQGEDFVTPNGNGNANGAVGAGEVSVFGEDSEGAESPAHPSSVPRNSGKKESLTAYYHGGLRSGQSIKYKGSVVIMGDVNPGSEIVADGNVVVLGALKGMAHAGASGDESCFVSALFLRPTQLRIAGLISYVPDTAKNVRSAAAYAYIKDGQVFIGPL